MKTITSAKNRLKEPSLLSRVLPTSKERFLIWEKARGMWQNRKPDPIKILKRTRKESERKLPKF